jgi:SAM-dependent MidA family methyltransferase
LNELNELNSLNSFNSWLILVGMSTRGHCLLRLLIFVALVLSTSSAVAKDTPVLANPSEVYHEVRLVPGAALDVRRSLLTFRDYQDLVLYDASFGYYSRGRVDFRDDYQTFPSALAPYFGRMVAEQVFKMWDGMRRAGTLAPDQPFVIAEFGAGNGALAESLLDYLDRQQRQSPDPRWKVFAAQVKYVCYDRSPAMSLSERERNARFGSRFEARQGDATDMASAVAPESMTGVILSNEMPDNFAVHKVRLTATGVAEVAFVIPSLPEKTWKRVKRSLPPPVQSLVEQSNREIANAVGLDGRIVFLGRDSFPALLKSLAVSRNYASIVRDIDMRELYEPVSVLPELAGFFRHYARRYADVLARRERGMITYVNLGEEEFIRGSAHALKAGYVMTIDYGGNWEGITRTTARPHLRTYGPGTDAGAAAHLPGDGQFLTAPAPDWRANSRPYRWPTLNDITSDVNFSHMSAEGERAGLNTVYFGPQRALLAGTPISLDGPAPVPDRAAEFRHWVEMFATDRDFKVLLQQKRGTDAGYRFPAGEMEPLAVDDHDFGPSQRQRADRIAERLESIP